tara:strand:- start:2030 stop:2518 length:489 start_codon:yes stop_codon:yes gene_type:complete
MSDYFHVVAKDEKNKEEVLLKDLSKKELKKLFLKPFEKGNNLLIEGTIYKNDEIKKVQIIKTEDTFDKSIENYDNQQNESRSKLNDEQYGRGVVFIGPHFSQDIDILECGEIVTVQFLTKAPKSSSSKLYKFFHNPWIVGIGGTIIAAIAIWLIAKYTGWAL